ncbi:hypothetical protein IFM89_005009 [Coptis chinensis]|uniref:Rubredoxin-like domain-containing protein n=1 Tax=Coptis chinensis TaxID=261450 RepID=A0A835HGH2_9MAGN|nr:hypothetical protein IFM89_005009 [Coptis chinensis]
MLSKVSAITRPFTEMVEAVMIPDNYYSSKIFDTSFFAEWQSSQTRGSKRFKWWLRGREISRLEKKGPVSFGGSGYCRWGLILTMASATARPTFSFHLHTSTQTQPSLTKPKTTYLTIPKKTLVSPLVTTTPTLKFTSNSTDVSKQDIPISEEPDSTTTTPSEPLSSFTDNIEEKFDKRRLEERFAVLNTGIHECRSCGYRYNEAAGDPSYPVPPGLPFNKLPEDWRCPTCGAAQSFFESKSVEIAGFAENQQFGLGANTLTGGQKLILIYGTLGLFFVLFLSGYFLQ